MMTGSGRMIVCGPYGNNASNVPFMPGLGKEASPLAQFCIYCPGQSIIQC
jgi:hypothetical protein